ncbi:MAG TPA: HAMP domain-containing protein, partial [Acidimicrobiales bacterium]|nr:HAMP domain-containing protein [Acidimicrobiales bacterium]
MGRPGTLQRRLRLLVGGVGLILVVLLTTLSLAVAEFRDGVNRREDLIPATADASELSGLLIDQLTGLDQARGAVVEAADFRQARQRAAVLVGRLERELADRPSLAAELVALREGLLAWQAAVTSVALASGAAPGAAPEQDLDAARKELTALVATADSLTASIAGAVEDVADDARTSRTVFLWTLAGAAVVCLVLLVLGAYALHMWVIVPVRRLSDDVSSVAEGAYDLPLERGSGRELDLLASSVVRMRDRILSERDRAVRAVEAMGQEAPAVVALRTLLAPREATPPPGIVAAGALLPAEGVLAGDWYDIAARDDEIVVAIGDVCGHGVDAGVLAVRTKFSLLDSIDLGLEPDAALELASRR